MFIVISGNVEAFGPVSKDEALVLMSRLKHDWNRHGYPDRAASIFIVDSLPEGRELDAAYDAALHGKGDCFCPPCNAEYFERHAA